MNLHLESIDIFTSTRDNSISISGERAVFEGISADGGLFVPREPAVFTENELKQLFSLDYPELAAAILGRYFDGFLPDELKAMCADAYAGFDDPLVAPLYAIDGNTAFCELWHGPTAAFKDIALQLMPRIFAAAKQRLGETGDTLVLTATSGDTGSAAMKGFGGMPGTKVFVVYPRDNVSAVQKRQMTALCDKNTIAVGIPGDFDDAQRAVKEIFADFDFAYKLAGTKLTSANSINIARLIPQTVYYFFIYFSLLRAKTVAWGEPVDFVVPSGNFGNILAGYYAKLSGLPVGKLVCACNSNSVLYDFITTGIYDAERLLKKTSSPSMDILVSSNVERLLWLIGCDDARVRELEGCLYSQRRFSLNMNEHDAVRRVFSAHSADDAEVAEAIKDVYDKHGYIIDPHTAAGYCALSACGGDKRVVISTANAHKFPRSVVSALTGEDNGDEFAASSLLEKRFGLPIPAALSLPDTGRASECDTERLRERIAAFSAGSEV